MKAVSLTTCALACLLLAGCAEGAIPELTATDVAPLSAADYFVITDVECEAAPGVQMTFEDLHRNALMAEATLKSISPASRPASSKRPLKLRIMFTSYHPGKVDVWKLIPILGQVQLTAVFSFIDDRGQIVGQYRNYNGFILGGNLVSITDMEAGLQLGLFDFVRGAGMDVAIPS